MNNSFLAQESTNLLAPEPSFDKTPWLRQREGELVKIIEAMRNVSESADWKVLKSFIFEGVVDYLEKEMLEEAKQDKPDIAKLASFKGQFVWAQKYSDLDSLAKAFSLELQNIRKQLHE